MKAYRFDVNQAMELVYVAFRSLRLSLSHPIHYWTHGNDKDPKKWPWWRLVKFSSFKLLHIHPPTEGWRLWVYTRKRAWHIDWVIDRRPEIEDILKNIPRCNLCGEPMPRGEEMFKYHGYSSNCPAERKLHG